MNLRLSPSLKSKFARMASKENSYQKLLVEGNDDIHVISALCQKFRLPKNFEIIDCKGIEKLLRQIPVRLKESDIKTLGIIIDADNDLNGRWNSIQTLFQKAGIEISILPENGFVSIFEDIKIGIWVMPNNQLDGMLEDFSTFLVPENDLLLPIAKEVIARIESEGLQAYDLIHRSKALMATWLAWQKDPGTPMGLAITKHYLSVEPEICKSFIDWLKRLYGESVEG